MTLPNFVVIGASRSGTTALHWYLSEHPEISTGSRHHIGYLAYALDEAGNLLYGDPELHKWPVKTLEEYERVFEGAGDAKAIGDISPIYLETPHAAARIRELLPFARIVCSLRNPVDRAYSDYLKYLRNQGLRIDPARDLTPEAAWTQVDSHWMAIGRYHEHLSRYYDLFPRDQIHVLLAEDLKRAPEQTVQQVYRFLGVDPGFVPDFDVPHNVGGVPSSMLLERLLTNRTVKAAVKPLVPRPLADWLRRVRSSNMDRPPPLPSELRATMVLRLEDQITQTAQLTGLDLDDWLRVT